MSQNLFSWERNGCALDPDAEIVAAATSREKRRIDALDINPAALHRFDAIRYFDQLACG
jgi:hypothetical protein